MTCQRVLLITDALEVQKRKADIARGRSAEDVGPEAGLGSWDLLNSLKGGPEDTRTDGRRAHSRVSSPQEKCCDGKGDFLHEGLKFRCH